MGLKATERWWIWWHDSAPGRVTGQLDFRQFHMYGNCVYQDIEITANDYPRLVALISLSLQDPCEQNPRFLRIACPRARGGCRL
jgi:hypothetical protein